eukprot:TRINITY_DN588_c0_g1_i2.p1 TRINITY_DN588_c0_g1~~TRINITY_DN588_c0_g1_i2.p1  ORF type:complete len:328 (-),score=43.75 TRINITY_DN588_c0_g1_i2:122-1012(-)
MAKVVLLTGASGNVGKATIAALAKFSDSIDVRAGVRDPTKPESAALASIASNTSVVAADPLSPEFPSALQGVDYLYVITPGHIDRSKIALAAVEGAKTAGIKFVLVLSVVTAELGDTVFGQQFGPVEAGVKSSGVPYTLIRVPIFVDNNYGYAGTIKEQGTFYGPVDPDKPFTPATIRDIAAVAAKILSAPEPHIGKTYKISSPAYTHNQLAKAFTDAVGKPVTYTQVSYEAAREALVGFGFQPWQVDGVIELNKLIDSDSPVVNDPEGAEHVEEILGQPAETIEEWTKAAAQAFQ